MAYFSGQGDVLVSSPSSGAAGSFRKLGNVSALSLNFEVDVLEHKESTSGSRLTDLRITRETRARMSATIEEWTAKNVASILWGTADASAGSSVVGETLDPASGVVVGDFLRTRYTDISAVVLKDSTGSPKTLSAGTNYRVASAKHGTIEILDLTTGGTFTQPFKIDYSYAAQTNVPMFTQSNPELWLRFQGLNTADSNKAVLIELYRIRLDPPAAFDLINDDIAKFTLAGSVLADTTKSADAVLGQFGRVVFVD